MSWRGGRGLGYWYSCLRESCCSVGSVLVCVSGHVIVMYVLCVLFLWNMCSVSLLAGTAYWSSSHHIHGGGTVGTFGVLEFNRFCFDRLGRWNPVIPRVRELAEFSSSLNTLIFSSGWNCCFVFLLPRYSLTSSFSLVLPYPLSLYVFIDQSYSLFVLRSPSIWLLMLIFSLSVLFF